SKSLKNFITVKDLLEKEISGIVIRYLLLSTHYRKPFDYNQKSLDDAQKSIEKFYSLFDENDFELYKKSDSKKGLFIEVLKELSEDLNVSKAFALLHEKVKEVKKENNQDLKYQFLQSLDLLGLIDENFFKNSEKNSLDEINQEYVESQIQMRIKAKQEKNWALADEIRKNLLSLGIVLEDSKEGTLWKKL
ncbi:MAG: hypothetical protein FJ368_04775, partial [Pelagibacterales bacterium]|nr:hypothetical protein [Pelagibacterales bacterium]